MSKSILNLSNLDHSTIELEQIDTEDYPDFVDAHILYGMWKDGTELTEAELDLINEEYRDYVYERVLDQLY